VATPSIDDGSSARRRDLRDRTWFRLAALAAVLLAAFLVTRGCASAGREISSERAVEIARDAIDFTPERTQVRFVQRGIPVQAYWAVSLYNTDSRGRPQKTEVLLVDARTGGVTRP
jgi:hypothetical protein